MPSPPIPDAKRRLVLSMLAQDKTHREISAATGMSLGSISKIKHSQPVPDAPSLPDPAPEAGGPALPEPVAQSYGPFACPEPGRWLVIGDVHIPFHSPDAIRAAVADAKKQGVNGVLLNGDTLDFYALSHHYREPNRVRAKEEIEKGREFLAWLRSEFPKARIVFKEGNHDERLRKYLAERAPEVFDLEDMHLPNLLHADKRGVEWVADKRVITLGKLAVVHGHEYKGGGGVQPSRWLYLRTGDSTLTNHFHRTDHYTFRTISDREVGMWSVGCLCYLKPAYAPLNQWSHGWALVDVSGDGYTVTNRQRLRCGRVV